MRGDERGGSGMVNGGPLWRRAVDVLLPPTRVCGDAAAGAMGWEADGAGEYCPRCGATAAFAAMTVSGCPHCRGGGVAWHGVWRLGAYRPPLAEWVVGYKFHRAWAWGGWFGRQLAGRVRVDAGERAVVVPVPLHWRRRLVRGYDQASLIAEAFGKSKGWPVAKLLRRRRATPPQTHLTSQEHRRRNVRGAFVLRHALDLSGWTVWLVDDVKTSGSTARACAVLLRRAGAERVNLIVVAVADGRGGDFERS